MIRLKRAYDPALPDDGVRLLVDRLWPRGLSKAAAAVDGWRRDLAPSDALRKWFGHDPARWDEFRRRYAEELRAFPHELAALRTQAAAGPVTLLYAAHDREHNNAVALKEVVENADWLG
jgi:uncharacterized protein YeaO (DUF488 family)